MRYESIQKTYPNLNQRDLDDLATRRVLEQVVNNGVSYIKKSLKIYKGNINVILDNLPSQNDFTELKRIENICRAELKDLSLKAVEADEAAKMLSFITNKDERKKIQRYGGRLNKLKLLINDIADFTKQTSISDPIPITKYKRGVDARLSKFRRAA